MQGEHNSEIYGSLLGLTDSELSALQTAETSFPEDSRVHFQLALTLDALGRAAEARRHYHQARLLRERSQPGESFL